MEYPCHHWNNKHLGTAGPSVPSSVLVECRPHGRVSTLSVDHEIPKTFRAVTGRGESGEGPISIGGFQI